MADTQPLSFGCGRLPRAREGRAAHPFFNKEREGGLLEPLARANPSGFVRPNWIQPHPTVRSFPSGASSGPE